MGEILYNRGFNGMLLRHLDEKEAKKVMKKMHEILCATHNNRNMLT
jgi:uncharacterized tellurite resistance protein B-like protein